jgi:nitroimidazol reductase NimA-like FMN-containing flavoprotein (pyridoxamine 5'-phosphate oxidase superfamily)
MPAKAKNRKGSGDPKGSRPHMPGYGVPRNHKGILPWKWAKQRLTKSHNYWLITTRPNGTPHAMPVWGVWAGGAFCFSTGRQSRKAKNLGANPHCVVCNELSKEAVIVEGLAKEITDPDQIKEFGLPYQRKYKPWKLDPSMGPIFIVRPQTVFAMYEKKFATAATKWEFEK